ncbi:MAG: hypothetical protein HC833_09155 [Leptolyngbyaceae cyanobacterium RM1_406_9]|nr:hypothetical protein [Leptolyngbyaceae cyanobacterium RM1_406_9]
MFNTPWITILRHRFRRADRPFRLSALMPEFWLPLPLLGIGFWVIGGLITEQLLDHSFNPVTPLGDEVQFNIQPPINLVEIRARLDKTKGITQVEAIQVDFETNSVPRSIKFEVPTTNFAEVEGRSPNS